MTDNTYSGTLKFKDVDFVFVFDGSELVLIPPKECKNDIMWGWLKKEICPGVYTSGDPLTVDVPYLDGFCNETSKRLIFLTREESTVGSRNSTLYINVAGYLECSPNTNGFCRMTLSGRALNYIHPVNRAFSQVFDSDDLTEKGIISIRTNGFDRTSTVKRAFRFEGRDIAAYFSVGWTCSMKISTPPITLNSSMIFEFDETDDYWFFYRLWHAAEDFLKYLTFSKNTLIEDCSLQAMYDDSHYPSTAEFKLARSSEPFDTKPLEKGRYIQLSLLDPYEIKMFGAIADGEIYLRHIPETYEKGHTLDASDFVLTSAAFEWEFDQAYPSGAVKSEARVAAEQRASAQMDECINQSSGKAKKILKYAKKSIGFSNLESKIVQAGRDFHEMIGVFGEGLYKRNDEEFSYEVIGSRLAEQRNDFAHGNIDKDFKGAAILDLLLLRYLVYAMQLKRIGVSAANTRRAINELFGLMYYLPAEDGDTETVAKNTEINEPNNETEGNADEIVEAE